jgi:hypothetical protein
MVTMEHKQTKPKFSKARLTNLNLNTFKIIETMGLKIIASRSPWMALPPYQISLSSTRGSNVISGGHTDWWSDKPVFIFGKQAKNYANEEMKTNFFQ